MAEIDKSSRVQRGKPDALVPPVSPLSSLSPPLSPGGVAVAVAVAELVALGRAEDLDSAAVSPPPDWHAVVVSSAAIAAAPRAQALQPLRLSPFLRAVAFMVSPP
ncbi:hypothetical protein [Streptomyces sp. NPDC020996]|uniref:hypothetical protein n=1 Tax=Streptomyces sp. NPDC020996 TaxID=3154791 RepID=UPI0033FB9E48